MLRALVPLAALSADLLPPRVWLERLAPLVPGGAATRWLLLADLACLVAIGRATQWPLATGIPIALGVGFVALNLVSMAVTDFYLGLALFHVAVGATAAVALPRVRWVGAALIGLTLALGILT